MTYIISNSLCINFRRGRSLFPSLVPSPNADFSRVKDPSVSEGLGSNKVPRDTLPQLKPNFFAL